MREALQDILRTYDLRLDSFPNRNFGESTTPVILAGQDQLVICHATEDNETWVISARAENQSHACACGGGLKRNVALESKVLVFQKKKKNPGFIYFTKG